MNKKFIHFLVGSRTLQQPLVLKAKVKKKKDFSIGMKGLVFLMSVIK